MMMNFKETADFEREIKKLIKKYRSLADDICEFKKLISRIPLGNSKHFVVLHAQKSVKIIKARLFCKYLKSSSLRIIYAFREREKLVEFIEIYSKGNKANEDRTRIKAYLKYTIPSTNISPPDPE